MTPGDTERKLDGDERGDWRGRSGIRPSSGTREISLLVMVLLGTGGGGGGGSVEGGI